MPNDMVRINKFLTAADPVDYYVFDSQPGDGLPENTKYFISERYCENPECDCKRLLADIIKITCELGEIQPDGELLATIQYDWLTKQCCPELHEISKKTQLSLYLLEKYKQIVHDKNYLTIIKKNYDLVKKLSAEKILNELNEEEMNTSTAPPLKKMGRNELCVCGSGKKYKKCCLGK